MRTREKRMVVVAVDAEELEEAARSSKCSVPEFVGMAVAHAIFDAANPDGEFSVDLAVDGMGFTVTHTPGGLGAD